jgi:HSP20 family molecular chaperone IbpA
MQQNTRLLIASVLVAALLPVTVWGYGFPDAPGDWSNRPYARAEEGSYFSGSLRMQTAMTADGYYVRANIEGLAPEDVQVYLRGNRLVVEIAQGSQYGPYNPGARRTSQWQMRLRRQLRLPYDADWTRMTTSTRNGVMEIYIPRSSDYMPGEPFPGR